MRVLIVEDHPIVIAACRALLADEVDTINEASDAAIGLASFIAEPPEICIIDVNLPSVSGLELTQSILRMNAEARIVILSIHEDPVFVERAVRLGVKGYVSKSGDPEDLVLAVREIRKGGTFLPSNAGRAIG